MSLEKKAKPESKQDSLSDEEELDLEVCVAMAKKLLMDGKGMDVVVNAIKTSQDPTSVIGQFFAQMFAQMQEKFPEELEISPRVYLCKGGVLEQLLDFLEEKIGLPSNWSDKVFDATVETIKAASMGSKNEAPPEQAPPGPGQAQSPQAALPQQQAAPMPAPQGVM